MNPHINIPAAATALDTKLTFQKYIDITTNKACGALCTLYTCFKWTSLSQRNKVTLYVALIHSMLIYGSVVWSILAKCHKKGAKIPQNKCLNVIFSAPRYTRISELQDVAALPYNDELLEDRVSKMFKMITEHYNPMVRTVGKSYMWRAKRRNFFTGIANVIELT